MSPAIASLFALPVAIALSLTSRINVGVLGRSAQHQRRWRAGGRLADENDLGYERHVLSPVFHTGDEVISEVRELDESRG